MPEDGRLAAWRRLALETPYAHGGPVAGGLIRGEPEDFLVEERLGFEPDGGTGHFLLLVEKRDTNTLHVARGLAALAGLPPGEIGFAGLKDRRAVARQWFSLPAGKGRPPPDGLAGEGFRVLQAHPHSRKLRRGALAANRFRLKVKELSGDLDGLPGRLQAMSAQGAPNYFGPQRFGRNAANLQRVLEWIDSGWLPRERSARGFLLSAARSLVFNAVLGGRVAAQTWDRLLPGEVANLDGSSSVFVVTEVDETLARRCREGDLHPTGPMCGEGGLQPADAAASGERLVLEMLAPVPERLAGAGLRGERRALVLRPKDLEWELRDQELEIGFELPRGGFATSLLREALTATIPDVESG